METCVSPGPSHTQTVQGRSLAVVAVAFALTLVAGASGSPTDHGGTPYAVSVVALDGSRPRLLFSQGRWQGHDLSANRRSMAYSYGRYYADVLYTARVPGTVLSEVAKTNGFISSVRWSPDGRRLAVVIDDDRNRDTCRYTIWIATLSTRSLAKLVDCATSPAWAPDSERIAFLGDYRELRVAEIATGSSRVVARADEPARPTWSPRGDRIAFVARRKLHVLRLADGKDLAVAPAEYGAAWSPDGRGLVFVGPRGLSVIDLDGARFRVLDPLAFGRPLPAWSPNGRWIAYVRFVPRPCRWCGSEVFVIRASGGPPRRITNESAVRLDVHRYFKFGPLFWSRDSRRVFYLHYVHFGE